MTDPTFICINCWKEKSVSEIGSVSWLVGQIMFMHTPRSESDKYKICSMCVRQCTIFAWVLISILPLGVAIAVLVRLLR